MTKLNKRVFEVAGKKKQLRDLHLIDMTRKNDLNTATFYRYSDRRGNFQEYNLTESSIKRLRDINQRGVIKFSQFVAYPDRLVIFFHPGKDVFEVDET